ASCAVVACYIEGRVFLHGPQRPGARLPLGPDESVAAEKPGYGKRHVGIERQTLGRSAESEELADYMLCDIVGGERGMASGHMARDGMEHGNEGEQQEFPDGDRAAPHRLEQFREDPVLGLVAIELVAVQIAEEVLGVRKCGQRAGRTGEHAVLLLTARGCELIAQMVFQAANKTAAV